MSDADDQRMRDLLEQIARIDSLIAASSKARVDTAWAPWQVVLTTLSAGAALFAAGAAFIKLLGS